MINEVYRVRTAPGWDGMKPTDRQHFAVKGSLAVITHRFPNGMLAGLAPSAWDGRQKAYNFRPCDLSRLGEYHEEVNQ